MLRLKVAEVARAQGMSQTRLQDASGLSRTTIRRYWHNHVRRITFTSLYAIAQALNVSFTDLFLGDVTQQGALEQRVQD